MRKLLITLTLPLALTVGCLPQTRVQHEPQYLGGSLEAQREIFFKALIRHIVNSGYMAKRSEQCFLWDEPYWRYRVNLVVTHHYHGPGREWSSDGQDRWLTVMTAFERAYADDSHNPFLSEACSVMSAKSLDQFDWLNFLRGQ
jgi:hypothetical protein